MFSEISLSKRRIEKDLSQVKIAEILNINKSSYSSWKSGRANPNQKNLEELAKILDDDVTNFESEYNIVNNFLQLTTANQQKAEDYVEELLQPQ
jgi:phage repressor protein